FVRFAVDFDIRIHEVIERRALLPWLQDDVASGRELKAVGIDGAEEVVGFFLRLPRLRNVYWHPSNIACEELCPAVIAEDFALVLAFGEWKANVEARGDIVGAHHADEGRVEIGAVTVLRVARPDRVTPSPACAGLVVAHGGEEIVVRGFRFADG